MTVKFFITPVYPYGNDHYYHEIIGLAEGLINLGHKVIGNVDYWKQYETNTYLINGTPSEDYDIAIYDYRYARSFEHLLMRKGHPNFPKNKKHILIDRNDWIAPFWDKKGYEIYDVIFAGNLFKTKRYPKNVKPWAIGLTQRIIEQIDNSYKTQKKELSIGYNFRVPHNMRKHVFDNLELLKQPYPIKAAFTDSTDQTLNEKDLFYWQQSTRRHNPDYYKLLNQHLLFMSFGGYMEYMPICYQPYSLLDKVRRKPYYLYAKFLEKRDNDLSKAMFVFQQDNFRFWEVLYSNAVPINLDLDSWNFLLPHMPENGKHYLGIKHFNFKEFEDILNSLSVEDMETISKNGRNWVLDKYSPTAMANYFLDVVNSTSE